jgi:hypothetical protein
MESNTVIKLGEQRQARAGRIARAVDARRRLESVGEPQAPKRRGRAWINGIEVGDARFGYLAVAHD